MSYLVEFDFKTLMKVFNLTNINIILYFTLSIIFILLFRYFLSNLTPSPDSEIEFIDKSITAHIHLLSSINNYKINKSSISKKDLISNIKDSFTYLDDKTSYLLLEIINNQEKPILSDNLFELIEILNLKIKALKSNQQHKNINKIYNNNAIFLKNIAYKLKIFPSIISFLLTFFIIQIFLLIILILLKLYIKLIVSIPLICCDIIMVFYLITLILLFGNLFLLLNIVAFKNIKIKFNKNIKISAILILLSFITLILNLIFLSTNVVTFICIAILFIFQIIIFSYLLY